MTDINLNTGLYSPVFKFIQKSADLKEICTCVDSELN